MKVNFIYTYSVDMEREQEGFFIVTPPEVSNVLIGTKFITDFCFFLYNLSKIIYFVLLYSQVHII